MPDPTPASTQEPPSHAKHHMGRASSIADLSLSGLLRGNPVFVPPPGAARVHYLADDESRFPSRPERHRQCLAAIRAGADTAGAIRKLLSFDVNDQTLIQDLRELARCGAIRVVTGKYSNRYLPSNVL